MLIMHKPIHLNIPKDLEPQEACSWTSLNEDTKNFRLYEVQELLRSQQLSFNKKIINSIIKVLVLKKGKKKHQYIGRSPFNQSVYFSSKNENLIGSFIDLNITDAFQNSLTGNILSDF